MASEYFQLGQLDCLQDKRIPHALGDIQVRMTYPHYQDPHFAGFGLQTPFMSLDMHESLLHEKGMLAEVRRCVLNRVGVWQIECPEIRAHSVSSNGRINRPPIGWHKDAPNGRWDRALLVDAGCSNVAGETNVTTRQIFLDICLHLDRYAGDTHARILNLLQTHAAYAEDALELINADLQRDPEREYTGQPRSDAMTRPDAIIRHFYEAQDPNKPADIEAYSTLAWDDHHMVHGASNPSGNLVSRLFYYGELRRQ